MYKLTIESGAQEDINNMLSGGGIARQSAAIVLALLQELKQDQARLGSMLDHGFNDNEIDVSKIVSVWREYDIWRLKVFESDLSRAKSHPIPYRIIYAYDIPCLTFRVLAVVPRPPEGDFDYEQNHPITIRILKDYEFLGLEVRRTRIHRPDGRKNPH